MDERLKKQMDFLLEVDKLKFITRQTYLSNGERKENDAEHSWHLALMAVLLREYSNEPVDVAKVMTMVLIHDLVERLMQVTHMLMMLPETRRNGNGK